MYRIPTASAEIQILTKDKVSETVRCDLVISETEREVLVSDMAIDKLAVILESPGKGL